MRSISALALAAVLAQVPGTALADDMTEIVEHWGAYYVSGKVTLPNGRGGDGAGPYPDPEAVRRDLQRLSSVDVHEGRVTHVAPGASRFRIQPGLFSRAREVVFHGELLVGSGAVWIYVDADETSFFSGDPVVRAIVPVNVSEEELRDLLSPPATSSLGGVDALASGDRPQIPGGLLGM